MPSQSTGLKACQTRQQSSHLATSVVHACLDCVGWAIDHLRNLLAGVTEAIEKLEHGSLLLGQLYERRSDPFTVVAVRPGLMRRFDEISHRFLMRLAAAASLERSK